MNDEQYWADAYTRARNGDKAAAKELYDAALNGDPVANDYYNRLHGGGDTGLQTRVPPNQQRVTPTADQLPTVDPTKIAYPDPQTPPTPTPPPARPSKIDWIGALGSRNAPAIRPPSSGAIEGPPAKVAPNLDPRTFNPWGAPGGDVGGPMQGPPPHFPDTTAAPQVGRWQPNTPPQVIGDSARAENQHYPNPRPDDVLRYTLGDDNWLVKGGYPDTSVFDPRFSFGGGPDPITGQWIEGDPLFVLDSYLNSTGRPEGMRNFLADDVRSMPGLLSLLNPGRIYTNAQMLGAVDPFVQSMTDPGSYLDATQLYDNIFDPRYSQAQIGQNTATPEVQMSVVFAGLEALAPYLGADAYGALQMRLAEAANQWKQEAVRTSGANGSFLDYLSQIGAQDWI